MNLKTYDPKIDKYLEDLNYICQENAIKVIFTNKNYVKYDNIKCSGYFDENDRVLACCLKTNNERWLSILIHEACHLDQWREKSEIFKKFSNHTLAGENGLDEWLDGKIECTSKEIRELIKITKQMEWDCEKRAMKKIKQYGLMPTVDITKYLQKAVIYIMFYDVIEKYRKWYDKSPCINQAIYNLVPKNYNLNKLPVVTPKIEKAIVNFSYKTKV